MHVTGHSADKLRPVAEAVGTEHLIADFSRLDDVRRLADQVGEAAETLDTFASNKVTDDRRLGALPSIPRRRCT